MKSKRRGMMNLIRIKNRTMIHRITIMPVNKMKMGISMKTKIQLSTMSFTILQILRKHSMFKIKTCSRTSLMSPKT